VGRMINCVTLLLDWAFATAGYFVRS
jgi:hypothetical protein